MSWLRDAMILVGLVAFGVGLYLYDIRLALIGVGGVMVMFGVVSILAEARE